LAHRPSAEKIFAITQLDETEWIWFTLSEFTVVWVELAASTREMKRNEEKRKWNGRTGITLHFGTHISQSLDFRSIFLQLILRILELF
jgi:hypothetical protein